MSTTNNAMDLPNVHAPENEGSSGEYKIVPPLDEVIWELALKNPMWTFKGTKTGSFVLSKFTISQSWETLGSIARSYNRRSGVYGVQIHNHRLETNDKSYRTADAAKAIAKIKKTFKPRSVLEIAAESEDKADTVVRQEKHGKDRVVNKHKEEIKQKAIDYVTNGPGYALFLEYAKKTNDASVANSLEMLAIASNELSTIEGIKDAMGAKESALIVVDEGKYLVKINDNVQLYDDTTLPVEYRGKLGLLKLVNEKQFVTDVGCRVSKEIYVLKLNKQTKGENE